MPSSVILRRVALVRTHVSEEHTASFIRVTRIPYYVRFEVFTAVNMKNGVFWVVTPCGSCKNHVSEEPGASFIRVTKIGALGTTQPATSNRRTYFFVAYVGY
jgi:hypothetical protein